MGSEVLQPVFLTWLISGGSLMLVALMACAIDDSMDEFPKWAVAMFLWPIALLGVLYKGVGMWLPELGFKADPKDGLTKRQRRQLTYRRMDLELRKRENEEYERNARVVASFKGKDLDA